MLTISNSKIEILSVEVEDISAEVFVKEVCHHTLKHGCRSLRVSDGKHLKGSTALIFHWISLIPSFMVHGFLIQILRKRDYPGKTEKWKSIIRRAREIYHIRAIHSKDNGAIIQMYVSSLEKH